LVKKTPNQDAAVRERGVYATPPQLVRYVVQSVDRLLQERFGRPEGLGDRDVRLLDPAAGPMNFVIEAARLAIEHGRGGPGALTSEHLGPHFAGIELVPEEHAQGVSAMQRFFKAHGASGQTRSLFLANSLAGSGVWSGLRAGCVAVVLGNPPWRGHSVNSGSWIRTLVRGYRLPDGRRDEGYFRVDGAPLGERNPKWLADDYVKFLRAAQWAVDRAGSGIVAFVVNHTCLDAPTFRGVRRSLLRTFDEIYAFDLHGNRRKQERSPDGGRDEGVFPGVAQGAAVLLLVKRAGLRKRILRADLYGARREKLRVLSKEDATTTTWTEIRPAVPSYLFVRTDAQVEREFRRGFSLPEIFPVYSPGVITGRDALFTGLDRRALEERIARLPGRGRDLPVIGFLTRPFDVRFLLYADRLIERPRTGVMAHMRDGANLGLVVSRQSKEGLGALVTRCIAGHKVVSAFDTNSLFPLYLNPETERAPNLAPDLLAKLRERYGVTLEPEDIFRYVYAVLYSPAYRERYREILRREFPRIVFPTERSLFLRLAGLGGELVGLHLLEDPRLARSAVCLAGDAALPLVPGRARWDYCGNEGRVSLNREGFRLEGIEPEVWAYRIGAYHVLDRWLSARAGRILAWTEARDSRWIAEALRLTLKVEMELAAMGTPVAASRKRPPRGRNDERHDWNRI
jgi:predicted helicase